MAEIKSDVAKPVRSRTKNPAPEGAAPARKPRASKKAGAAPSVDGNPSGVSPEQRYRMIAENAYHRAEKRGFIGGDPLNDWLLAELEVDKQLKSTQ